MTLAPYRRALALPGIRPLLLVAIFARMPVTAAGVTVTLHVVTELDRGYAAAGLVATALTVGSAIGSPLLGRLIDRRGLRPTLMVSIVAEALFWGTAHALPYPVLLLAAFGGGLLTLPIFSVVRQSIAALTPEQHRRPAYALDSMSVELSFMVGPALAVLMATTVSARLTMIAVGTGIVLGAIALFALNPPVREAGTDDHAHAAPVARRGWLTARLLGVLALVAAAALVLGGSDVAVVAVLRANDQTAWTGAVLAAWGAYSLLGGFVYGSMARPVPPVVLVALLGATTIPVGLGGGQWWLLGLALLPAGMLCAPALASTADAVSRLAPPTARGVAMGLHGSALTIGMALGAPLAGAVIDLSAPAWGFAATGVGGLLVALAVLSFSARARHAQAAHAADPAGPESTGDATPTGAVTP